MVDGNGAFDPTVDVSYPGAHQTVWTIGNDVPTIVDAKNNSGVVQTLFSIFTGLTLLV